ncbi:MAG: YdcH family protein [Pseudomonadota bacterium]|nr:YdcH family protein [Pseudomonadota bacterium]
MTTSETDLQREELSELVLEHRALDRVIARMIDRRDGDEMEMRRLKKRKLALKDRIARLRSDLIPDLHA